MKILSLLVFLALFRPVFAQDAVAVSTQPSKEVDAALRARVTQFYQAFIAGKFNEAYGMVAVEAQNHFIESGKAEYNECSTDKIDFNDNFTDAAVTNTCKGVWHWQGHTSPSQVAVLSHWKLVDGKWYWYYVQPRTMPNPFAPNGVTVLPPDYNPNAPIESLPRVQAVPKNMKAVAANILSQVILDKTSVSLRSDMASKDEIHVRNSMPGEVTLALAPSPVAGLKATASKTTLKANETAVINIQYAPDDKSIVCGDCATRIKRVWIQLTVEPTQQVFQLEVNFTGQSGEQFVLPKQ